MTWEQWTIPVVLLGGIGALYYLMAKKGIGGCGSMMSSGCGMGEDRRESPPRRTEAQKPAEHPGVPAQAARNIRGGIQPEAGKALPLAVDLQTTAVIERATPRRNPSRSQASHSRQRGSA